MRAQEFITEQQLEEGWREQMANLAISGALAGVAVGGLGVKQALTSPTPTAQSAPAVTAPAPRQDVKPTPKPAAKTMVAKAPEVKPQAKPKAKPQQVNVKAITGHPNELILKKAALAAGIKGTELAAFLAQCAHESHDFKSLVEYGGSLDFRKYDPKYAPKKARALGNKYIGDGAKFKGRGFIQITGRYNYKRAGEALGIDLVKNPRLAADPKIAAKIAVWFWQQRVKPNVDDFRDVEDVTKPINPGLNGLQDRRENFRDYMKVAMN